MSLLILSLLACTNPPCMDLNELGIDTSAQPGPAPAQDFPDFALGVEYIATGVASEYGRDGLNAQWAKTRLEAFEWGESEPEAPIGGAHEYDWSCPDAQIAEWQHAGVAQLQAYFTSKNPWGNSGRLDFQPTPEHQDDFELWVTAMMERYDGDGEDDMPGLVQPVRHWVFGGEWTGFWPSGDAGTYLDTATLARDGADAASDQVLLGAVPFFLIDIFHGNEVSEEQVAERWQEDPQGDRHDLASHLDLLDGHELFDYVNVHSLGDYTELRPTYTWMRQQLSERGGADKPIWIDDAFPMHFLANDGYRPAWYPTTDDNYDAVFAVLRAVAEDPQGQGPETAWVRAETAKGTVKKAVAALGEGYVGIQLGNTVDWMESDSVPLRNARVNLIGAAAMMGMVDTTHPQGIGLGAALVPGDRRPAWHAFDLVNEKLGAEPWDSVTAIGGAEGVRGYQLERGTHSLWVLWTEDSALQLPGETAAPLPLSLDVGAEQVQLILTPTTIGVDGWEVETIDCPEGTLSWELTETPLFIERQ